MALRYALDAERSVVGVACPEAYGRIAAIRFVMGPETQVEVAVETYATEAARRAGKQPVASQVYGGTVANGAPSPDGPGPLRVALYAWLRTLPDFAGAADLVEPPVKEERKVRRAHR